MKNETAELKTCNIEVRKCFTAIVQEEKAKANQSKDIMASSRYEY